MIRYIPDGALKNKYNKKKIEDILKRVPDTDVHAPGDETIEDAIAEIKALGEEEVANLIAG